MRFAGIPAGRERGHGGVAVTSHGVFFGPGLFKRGIPTEDAGQKAMNQWWFKFDKMLRDTNNVVVTKAKPSQCVPDNKADQPW